MIVNAREFAGALKAARLFASSDETRPHLHCVHLAAIAPSAGAPTLRIVATDGHTMWCCEVPARESSADIARPTPWNASIADVDQVIAMAKVASELEVLVGAPAVGGTLFKQACERFSPYGAVLPAVVGDHPDAGKLPELDPDYITRACKALALYGAGFAPPLLDRGTKQAKKDNRDARLRCMAPPVTWRSAGELDPVVVFSPRFPSAFALIMPRRGIESGAAGVQAFVERVRRSA